MYPGPLSGEFSNSHNVSQLVPAREKGSIIRDDSSQDSPSKSIHEFEEFLDVVGMFNDLMVVGCFFEYVF